MHSGQWLLGQRAEGRGPHIPQLDMQVVWCDGSAVYIPSRLDTLPQKYMHICIDMLHTHSPIPPYTVKYVQS